MPFQVVTHNDINKKKGVENQDPIKKINIIKKEKKIIKIESPKKITIIPKNELTPTKEILKNSPVKNIEKENSENIEPKAFILGDNLNMRKIYSISKLLQLEPKKCVPPPNYQEFPEILRTGGIVPKAKKNYKSKRNLIQKRSPAGETNKVNQLDYPLSVEKIGNDEKLKEKLNDIKLKPEEKVEEKKNETENLPFIPLFETDVRRLEQRQKQIDLGKKTLSYFLYCKKVPKNQRKRGDPITPRKNQICSKRSWDGQIRKWRRMLHEYDPKTEEEINEALKLYPEEASSLISQRGGNAMEYYDVIN